MLVERHSKGMSTRAIRHEENIRRLVRLRRRHQAGASGVCNRRWWQAGDHISVVWRLAAQLAAPQTAPQHALALGNPVDHSGVRLQPHPLIEAVHENTGPLTPLFGHAGFLLDDRREDQQLFGCVHRQILRPCFPRSRQQRLLRRLHPRDQRRTVITLAHLIAVRRK